MRGKTNLIVCLLFVFFLPVTISTVFGQISPRVPEPDNPLEIIYVDDDADGFNLGTSWENALNSLQDALLLAYFSDGPVEIRVAEGVYTPDRGLGIRPGDQNASFELINGVTIKGGYNVTTSGDRGGPRNYIRDTNLFKSVLSGDLNADDDRGMISDNSVHVVTSIRADETAVLDGFTITDSGFPGPRTASYTHSSGMYNDNSSPTLIDCTFSENGAPEIGAGMYNVNSNPVLINCTFSENATPEGGSGMYNENSSPTLTNCTFVGNNTGGSGAGMYNVNSNPVLLNCMFTDNIAGRGGGGMYNYNSSPMLTNCTFSENTGGENGGGGMYNEEGSPMLADCVFRRNSATTGGGGIFNRMSRSTLLNCEFTGNSAEHNGGGIVDSISSSTLTNCTFTENSAVNGGAIYCIESTAMIVNNTILSNTAKGRLNEQGSWIDGLGGGICCSGSTSTIANNIICDNSPDEIYVPGVSDGRASPPSSPTVIYNNVKGGFPDEGNIDVEPMFADADNGDYHLKSQAGRWDPAAQNWVIDDTSSLCIDAGNPNDSVGLERFPNGARVNMGAYGGTPQASLSPRQIAHFVGQASNPNPPNGAIEVELIVTLSWAAGLNAVSHDVYIGTDRDEVANADTSDTTGIYRGRQSVTNYSFPEGFIGWGVDYYWRIDEINSEGEVVTGVVWTFTTFVVTPPKGRGCFLADTPVWIDGDLIQISKVTAGRMVGKTTCLANTTIQVEKLQEHEGTYECYDVLLESGDCISVAECHYFLTESGRWIALQDLRAGTKLQTSKGSIEISRVTKRPMPYTGRVYNIKVKGSNRYLVGKDAIIVRDY
jgi:predicted outer membrane repeat protein